MNIKGACTEERGCVQVGKGMNTARKGGEHGFKVVTLDVLKENHVHRTSAWTRPDEHPSMLTADRRPIRLADGRGGRQG